MFVSLHHAVVLQEAAYIPWGAGDGLRALRRAEGLRVVAVGDGSVSVAGDGLRIAVVRGGDGQRGGSEDTVSDDGGSGTLSNIGILIARDPGATLIVDTCHRAVEHASADGEAAAYRTCHEASQGCIFVGTKLSTTITTTETVDEYKSFDKKRKSDCKDYGGFVGGKLKGTHRKASEVEFRSLITLDMDKAKVGFYEKFDSLCEYACFLYTTHGHRPESPRYRLVFPLARDIDPDEFTAISRLLADKFGIDQFDPVSFKIEQIMFWPSTCVDGVFVSRKIDKEPLDPDAFLKDYPDWKNLDTLPRVSKEDNKIAGHGAGRKMSDPREKPGVVGAFNRVYSITHAIDEFLSDVYEEADRGSNRYHFIGSSSIAGALVYDDLYFYSHHASDPAFGKTLDAFSLVKLHKFGDEKDSFTKMKHFALEQDDVRSELARTKYSEAKDDFEGYDEEGEPAIGDTNWRKHLEFDFNGKSPDFSILLDMI